MGPDQTKYRLLSKDYVSVGSIDGTKVLKVDPAALTFLANQAMRDVNFLLRPGHLEQLSAILSDPEASSNDRFVALTLLRNAEVSARFELPLCQDTGTVTIFGKKGQQVWTGADDKEYLSKGARQNLCGRESALLPDSCHGYLQRRLIRDLIYRPRSIFTQRTAWNISSYLLQRGAVPQIRRSFTRKPRRC